jgi:SAM-dependent methyltransferase
MNRKERRAARKEGSAAVAGLFDAALRHHRAGQLAEADRLYRQILAIDPDHLDTLHALAWLAQQAGRNDIAIDLLSRLVALDPGAGAALGNLGKLLFLAGDRGSALDVVRRALAVEETDKTKVLFVECVKNRRSLPPGDDFRELLFRALSEPWGRPSDLATVANGVIKSDGITASSGLAMLAGHRLLRAVLESTPVCDVELERCLTGARASLLALTLEDGPADQNVLDFACALARQCFINEYVFAGSDEEFGQAAQLRDKLIAQPDSAAAPLQLATVACYGPLHSLPSSLLDRAWPGRVEGLLTQQVHEPAEERTDRASIPRLTDIAGDVSRAVRQQYEENPYPRWAKLPRFAVPMGLESFLRATFPSSAFRPPAKADSVEILIAGCGTGQQSIEAAQDFAGAHVLAVDLSLASLAYARRKSRELAIQNVEYAQADIMVLGSLGRTFDVIEATGSLQALAAPLEGWRVLLSCLRPGGFMRIGLYSEIARAGIVAARIYIAERSYGGTADDIRRCRQELLGSPDESLRQVAEFWDFFTISNCRDLLFHVQEHRSTLPEIAAFLAQNDLGFVGFELDPHVAARYARRFPGDRPMTDLANWHLFETENPKTFMGMYQFWVQKR